MTSQIDKLFAEAEKSKRKTLSKNPPRLTVKDGVGFLEFDALSLSSHEAGKKMPSRFRWKGEQLMFEATDQALAYVKRTWPNRIVISSDVGARKKAPAPLEEGREWSKVFPDFDHQADAYNASADEEAFAYFMDMGTGKSKVLIDNAAHLYANGKIDRVLIVAPNDVHTQWVEEALTAHWPPELPIDKRFIQAGKKKPEWWGNWQSQDGEMLFLTVNFDLLEAIEEKRGRHSTWDLGELGLDLEKFLKAGPSMMGLDESHKIKNPFSQRSRAAHMLGPSADYRRILTGTPIAKGPEDYFSQFKFLDWRIIGCNSMAGFKNQFCQMGGFQGKEIISYNNTEELHARIAPYVWRVKKEDVLDLPPKMYSVIKVDLTDQQRRAYTNLKNEWRTELSNGEILNAQDAMVRLIRFQQVVQGFLPMNEEATEFTEYPENKIAVIKELFEQASGKVVIWSRFRRDSEKLVDALGPSVVRYHDKATRAQAKQAFIDPDSGIKGFIGNPASGGTGVDGLQHVTDTVIYNSNSFNSIERWQSEDRTHRQGTKGTVNYYDIIARRTVDLGILNNLKRKRDVADMSLGEINSLIMD